MEKIVYIDNDMKSRLVSDIENGSMIDIDRYAKRLDGLIKNALLLDIKKPFWKVIIKIEEVK